MCILDAFEVFVQTYILNLGASSRNPMRRILKHLLRRRLQFMP